MEDYRLSPIGMIKNNEKGTFIELEQRYIPALQALDGFSHINVLWWFNNYDDKQFRSVLQTEQPYKNSPKIMGIFATRSPIRPNLIGLSVSEIINIDFENGIIEIAYIDANDNTPLLDIKPYTPSLDRVENPVVPTWCSHWPKNIEESGNFAWEDEFNF